jgi:hypothetical protein
MGFRRFALLIGAIKCGTTSLFRSLTQHPGVTGCSQKEPNFFSINERYERGFEWYRSLWEDAPEDDGWAFEASANYARRRKHPLAAERIATARAEHGLDVRLFYSLRDPLVQIESHYRHLIATEGHPGIVAPDAPLAPGVLAAADYAWQLDAYRRALPDVPVVLLSFERFLAEPDRVLAKMARHLGVDGDHPFERPGENHNPTRADHPLWHALARAPGARWAAGLVPDGAKRTFRRALSREVSGAYRLSPLQREQALETLAPGIRRLREEYGFDVGRWRTPVG